MEPVALVTGFVPFGGRPLNPSEKVARSLDGERSGGTRIVSRVLPVEFAGLEARIEALVQEVKPRVVLSLGLAQGEPAIRLERVAVNLADCASADNAGTILSDAPVAAEERAALFATLPLRRIERRLLECGIPAPLSTSAGTFLCNATPYGFLRELREAGSDAPCGLVHLPYLPEQAAGALLRLSRERNAERISRFEFASLHLDTMVQAARTVLEVCLA